MITVTFQISVVFTYQSPGVNFALICNFTGLKALWRLAGIDGFKEAMAREIAKSGFESRLYNFLTKYTVQGWGCGRKRASTALGLPFGQFFGAINFHML